MTVTLVAPFAALRPTAEAAAKVAARPYDVLSYDEACAEAAGNPFSFLHISRAEIDLPAGTDPHSPSVYETAHKGFLQLQETQVLIRETVPSYYAYRMSMGGHVQTGIAAGASVAAYEANRIRRHEHTRPDKEEDRTRQIEAVAAHTGPVLTLHPADVVLAEVIAGATAGAPLADARTVDGVRHQTWRISDPATVAEVTRRFEGMPALYIADGHHRSAAASRVAAASRTAGRGGSDRFLIISFPTDNVRILDYNRVVRDLDRQTPATLVAALRKAFIVHPEARPVRPAAPGEFGMYLNGQWLRLTLAAGDNAGLGDSPVDRLDVSRLSRLVLDPLLGITDPRTDPRIDFVGGGRGLEELARRVDSGAYAVAFSLFPTPLADLMAIADAGLVMPPKSTWFEPKLADGLLSLPLD